MRSLYYSVTISLLAIVIVLGGVESSIPQFCSGQHQFWCENSDRCIPIMQKCDGHRNCEEGEDEDSQMCQSRACNEETAPSLDKFYCRSEKKCIDKTWVCDGFPDCTSELATAEDEDARNCTRRTCSDSEFPCGDGECINKEWHCDGQNDCKSKADEADCSESCKENEFTCPATANVTMKCISKTWMCDSERDCDGGEDEADCEGFTCPDGYFHCGDEKCIPERWKCDGDFDCHNKQDEENCDVATPPRQNVICTTLEFTCESGGIPCILKPWRCDGTRDCTDGSDEADCEDTVAQCTGGEFLCQADNRCIPGQLKCSGKWECSDGEDEQDCERYCDIKKREFTCDADHVYGSQCISVDDVCNGEHDCDNGYDEDNRFCSDSAPQKHCEPNNPCGDAAGVHCQDVFTNTTEARSVGYYCECTIPGQQLRSSDNTCIDINECQATEAACDQLCFNTEGSYRCDCNQGYTLQHDGRSCKAQGVLPRLLFTNRHQIRSMHFHGPGEYMPLVDSKAAVAIDFDYSERKVFFSDMTEKKIYYFTLPRDDEEAEPQATALNIDGIETPDGLAYDWVYKHLYWTDTASNTINMADVRDLQPNEKPIERTLYQNDDPQCYLTITALSDPSSICIDEPRALVIHPRKGWIFWSDWGTSPYIAMAALDGSDMTKLVYNTEQQTLLTWPNGLTLDQTADGSEQLYWIDAKLNSLFSCSLNNCMKDARLLAYDKNNIKHPWSITVFESQLFWSDWHNQMIFSASKRTGENIQTVLTNLEQPMDLKVFHPVTQPTEINRCENLTSDSSCEYLCVPKPWNRASHVGPFIPPSLDSRHKCLCPRGYDLNSDGRTCTKISTEEPVKSLVHDTPLVKPQTKQQPQNAPGMNVGMIAAIAASTVGGIIVIIIVAVLLVLRKVKRNKSKSMNFENPIYKRTTEDKLELPRHEYQPSSSVPSAMVPLTAPESQASTSHDYDA